MSDDRFLRVTFVVEYHLPPEVPEPGGGHPLHPDFDDWFVDMLLDAAPEAVTLRSDGGDVVLEPTAWHVDAGAYGSVTTPASFSVDSASRSEPR